MKLLVPMYQRLITSALLTMNVLTVKQDLLATLIFTFFRLEEIAKLLLAFLATAVQSSDAVEKY